MVKRAYQPPYRQLATLYRRASIHKYLEAGAHKRQVPRGDAGAWLVCLPYMFTQREGLWFPGEGSITPFLLISYPVLPHRCASILISSTFNAAAFTTYLGPKARARQLDDGAVDYLWGLFVGSPVVSKIGGWWRCGAWSEVSNTRPTQGTRQTLYEKRS